MSHTQTLRRFPHFCARRLSFQKQSGVVCTRSLWGEDQWDDPRPQTTSPYLVKELGVRSEGKLTVQLYWLPTNASWLDQIEIWFSLMQRKLLQPNHFNSRDELETAILNFIVRYNQIAKPLKWSYTVEDLEHKLASYL